jgi:hypothetical protein
MRQAPGVIGIWMQMRQETWQSFGNAMKAGFLQAF